MENIKAKLLEPRVIKVCNGLAVAGLVIAAAMMYAVNRDVTFMDAFQFLFVLWMYMTLLGTKKKHIVAHDVVLMGATFLYALAMIVYFGQHLRF
ncbi:hypothetical protein [Dubosiella muris]|uniref:Uncharacterized protein n=1 Tax=Dubosiella muris TaxID=3038133 RepID=A0AC61R693_9FIRM|nr:hypothetical protein [Dubosiella muris]TGY65553.1 hypothetical protein E5336_08295 [Dubosiella muris]